MNNKHRIEEQLRNNYPTAADISVVQTGRIDDYGSPKEIYSICAKDADGKVLYEDAEATVPAQDIDDNYF